MSLDISRIADQVNAFWAAHSTGIILATGLVALSLVVAGIVKVVRSQRRDRLIAIVAAALVLAWTSEGLWEVARYTIGLPVPFALATFAVFEAMMFRSATQAERHRRRYGTPGAAGRYVWVLATLTAVIVALNASSTVEALLRFVLPLAAAGLWWVDITAERDSDYEPNPLGGATVAERRAARAAEREATWTVTPSTVLVRLGIKRPGKQDITEAERDYRRRRMVVHADRVLAGWTADNGLSGVLASWSAARLRKLARHATEDDVTVVLGQAQRAAGVVAQLVEPAADATAVFETNTAVTSGNAAGSPETDEQPPVGDNPAPNPPRKSSAKGSGRVNGRKETTEDRVAKLLRRSPNLSNAQLAVKLDVSERTIQRAKEALTTVPSPNGSEPQQE